MASPNRSQHTRVQFPHTDWSLIRAVQLANAQDQNQVLGRFLDEYLPAMRAHLRAKRFFRNETDNEDLLSDFVADKLVAADLLKQVRHGKGRFRSYLRVCLDNYAKSQLRQRVPIGTVAVGGGGFDAAVAAAGVGVRVNDLFELEWARTVVERALAFTKAECIPSASEPGKPDQSHIWAVFEARLVLPMTGQIGQPIPYRDLANRLGVEDARQLHNWLVTGIRKFERHLTAVIGEYAHTDQQVKEEIRELFTILGRAAEAPDGEET